MLKELEPLDIYWFEEALHPDDYEGYAQLKKVAGKTMITTGEHEYTRYGFKQLLMQKCAGTARSPAPMRCSGCDWKDARRHMHSCRWNSLVSLISSLRCGLSDVLQPDVNWVGGATEARRIVALAAAFDIPVIPHGSSVYSYHLQMAFPSCPRVRALIDLANCFDRHGSVP